MAADAPATINESIVAGAELVYLLAFAMSLVAVLLPFIVYRAKLSEADELTQKEEWMIK